MRRVVFCGRKSVALTALDYALDQGWEVLPVVSRTAEPSWMERPSFVQGLVARGLPSVKQGELLRALSGKDAPAVVKSFLERPVDLVVSYLFPERIQPPLLRLPTIAAVNLHPGPLPEFGGLGGYSFAILEGFTRYGVTAHHMDETFDTGDIVLQVDFEYSPDEVTALDLERMTRPYLLTAFREVVDRVARGEPLPAIPQGITRYVTKDERESAKIVDPLNDNLETIDRKARAFWYPPYNGACFQADGHNFTVVPERELAYIGRLVHDPGAQRQHPLPETRPVTRTAASALALASAAPDLRQSVAGVINHILADTGRPRREFADDDLLMAGIGLDSLDLAVMTVSLERDLGVDPFRDGRRAARTFAELITVYEDALGTPS